MRISSLVKIGISLLLVGSLIIGLVALQISKNLTPQQELLIYIDKTISKINSSPYKSVSTGSFSKYPSIVIIDSKDRVYSEFDNEKRMQISDVEYLKDVPLYNEPLREPALDLGIDPNFGWISHPLKIEAAKDLRNELSINFENDRKVFEQVKKIRKSKSSGDVVFELVYPVALDIKYHHLGGNFQGDMYKRLVFKDGLLREIRVLPKGEAANHLAKSDTTYTFKNFDVLVPKDVLPIAKLQASPKFWRAQNIIAQKVFLIWVLRVVFSKSGRNARDFSEDVLKNVVKDFIDKRYVPPSTSLQIINGKINLTTFVAGANDVNNPANIVSCGTIENGRMIMTEGRC